MILLIKDYQLIDGQVKFLKLKFLSGSKFLQILNVNWIFALIFYRCMKVDQSSFRTIRNYFGFGF